MKIDYYHFDVLSSTNDFAKENESLFDSENLSVISAKTQTNGRGRRERTWISPQGNLYASFGFHHAGKAQVSSCGIVMAISCCQVIDRCAIKWPNDLLIDGMKVGGILTEVKSNWVIVGVGINLNTPIDLPNTTHVNLEIEPFLKQLSEKFLENTILFEKEGFGPFIPLLNQYSSHVPNSMVTFKTEKGPIEGIFLGYGAQGEIILSVNGVEKRYFSGEF